MVHALAAGVLCQHTSRPKGIRGDQVKGGAHTQAGEVAEGGAVRVLALLPYPVGRAPGQRYRLEQWAPLLASSGVSVTYSAFLSPSDFDLLYEPGRIARKGLAVLTGYAGRLRLLRTLGRFDVAYVYREAALLGSAWLEALIARRCPIVFDFDDAIYLSATSDANRAFGFLKRPGKVAALCKLASAVTVGNDTLAAFARCHAARVEVIPSTIDTDIYRVVHRDTNPRPVIGWTGSPTTAGYLLALGPVLRRLRERHDFELRVIGATVTIDGLDVRCLPWRAETEADDLRPIDVGLMPLTDDDWARGKCALKALQYMGLGIPPVVSPIGASAVIVRDGVNGFHAASGDAWVNGLSTLLGDPVLRARLGAAARETVQDHYAARVHAPRLGVLLKQVCRETRTTGYGR
jgi:glycosyltransferase involved in cell wall biosynthesis